MKRYESIANLIAEYRVDDPGWTAVHGGDINDAFVLSGQNGERLFLKTNTLAREDMFMAEAEGLKALSTPGIIKTPEILGYGIDYGRNISFLALSFVEGRHRKKEYWEDFGHNLAKLHTANVSFITERYTHPGIYGFTMDNYIGSSVQKNTADISWVSFYRDYRLKPQLKMAEKYFSRETIKAAERLLENIGDYLFDPGFPSLLHGDLWGGNVICGEDGNAWLIDPASYIGHYEADIAMTELFDGFHSDFYSAYKEICPLDSGYGECRKDLYQLYHLLNHLNLFGRSYLGSVESILQRY